MDTSLPLQFQHSLKNLGFSSNEVSVMTYLFQAKKGEATQISKSTGINLSGVQFALTNLQRKNLVKLLPKSDDYQICDQGTFQGWVNQQRLKNQEIYRQAEKDMRGFFDFIEENRWSTVQEGEQVQEVFNDLLESGEDNYCWTDMPNTPMVIGEDFFQEWVRKRTEKGIKSYAIVPDDTKNRKMAGNDLRICRFAKGFECPGQIRIYGNKIWIMSLNKKEKPISILLEGKGFAQLFKNIFKLCWDKMGED